MVTRLTFALFVLLAASPLKAQTEFQYQQLIKIKPGVAPEILTVRLNEDNNTTIPYDNKVTLVHFWASWCIPCHHEMPLLVNLKNDYSTLNNFQIIALAADSHENTSEYIKNHVFGFIPYVDQYGKMLREFSVKGLPASFLINRKGEIIYMVTGTVNWSDPKTRTIINVLINE